MKLQHPDRVNQKGLKPVEFGDDKDYIDLHKAAGWYEVEPDTGKPKD
jgi:hypothetical protein